VKEIISWPPIINSDEKLHFIRFRDLFITAIAWIGLVYIMRDFIGLVYDYFSDPIFQLTPEQTPNWGELWRRIADFIYIALGLMSWITGLGLTRKRIIKQTSYIYTLPASIEMEELARAYGISSEDISNWHEMRSVNVFIDSNSKIVSMESNEKYY